VAGDDVEAALVALEAEGAVLRGAFTPGVRDLEWCDRRLLARIHRYTLGRLRAEIAPVSPAEFMRFLFAWQHVGPSSAFSGIDGLRAVLAQLDGIELPARAWERHVLPARVQDYQPAMLDMLCLTGEVAWGRVSSGPTQVVGATPIAIFLRTHADAWLSVRGGTHTELTPSAGQILERLRSHGASFAHEIGSSCRLTSRELREGLHQLVAAGLVSSDGFAGLRAILEGDEHDAARRLSQAGRWFVLRKSDATDDRDKGVELFAWALLRRYGVVFRRLLAREAADVAWRELARVYRRLEMRGEIRGGRFVTGVSGEQFALPEAVERLREVRRSQADDRLIAISAADPLNLTGILGPEDRVRASASNRIVYRNGVALAALEGDMLRTLSAIPPEMAMDVAAAAAGRRVPVASGYVGRTG
jgi:ATP-dependent Lhr-like helicase